MKEIMGHYRVGSLFAGIGGICLGFQRAGCVPVWANEWDPHACRTYRRNFSHRLVEGDIHNICDPLAELGKIDILTSGFPCQAFSVAGLQKGFKDPRGNLFFETARFIDNLQPKAFLIENVKNLLTHDGGRTFEVIQTVLRKLGYRCHQFVLNAKDYGNIPQTRERIYIVGFREEQTYQKFIAPHAITLTKSVRDLIEPGIQPEKYYYHDNKHYEELKQTMTNWNTVYQLRRVYVRENKNNVCPTLTANMGTGGHNVPLILDAFGIRKLTPQRVLAFSGLP